MWIEGCGWFKNLSTGKVYALKLNPNQMYGDCKPQFVAEDGETMDEGLDKTFIDLRKRIETLKESIK